MLARTAAAVRRSEKLQKEDAAYFASAGTANATANTTANATPPVYAEALTELRKAEKAVANLTNKIARLSGKVLAEENLIRLVSDNLTKSQKWLYRSEWVVRQNRWTLGKSQVVLADANTSLSNEGDQIKMTSPQTSDVKNATNLLAAKANLTATPDNMTAVVNVETALWNSMNPAGKTSIDGFEKRLTKDELTFKDFKMALGKEVRRVLAGESKSELDKLRKAVFHLGKEASGSAGDEDEDQDQDDDEYANGLGDDH